jgi:type III restriction enzyme
LPQLAPYEQHDNVPKPYAILKYPQRSLNLLALLWEKEREKWAQEAIPEGDETRRVNAPVFLIVCQNLALAQVVYKWLAENEPPFGVPPSMNRSLFNDNGQLNTILVDPASAVGEWVRGQDVAEDGEASTNAARWMELTLASVGKREWPKTGQGEPLYPTGFEELAQKLGKQLHPPGRDVRGVISAGLLLPSSLSTVTHLIAWHPFTSQLQCEMVMGSVLARESYEDHQGQFREEVLKVCGIPFEVVPFKANDDLF